MTEWKPIEAAPTDTIGYFAVPVLIGYAEWGDKQNPSKHVGPIVYYDFDKRWEFCELDFDMFSPPQKWMPLPEPPK